MPPESERIITTAKVHREAAKSQRASILRGHERLMRSGLACAGVVGAVITAEETGTGGASGFFSYSCGGGSSYIEPSATRFRRWQAGAARTPMTSLWSVGGEALLDIRDLGTSPALSKPRRVTKRRTRIPILDVRHERTAGIVVHVGISGACRGNKDLVFCFGQRGADWVVDRNR